MHPSRLVLPVLAVLGLAAGASATTFVLPEDGQLADQAAVVVEGTVEAVGGVRDVARPLTEARVRIERQIKGRVPGGSLRVRVLGGEGADGKRLVVWGAPQFRAGERVLLFLVPHADGAYRPLHLALGAFHEVELAGRRLALREVGDAQILAPGGGEAKERARDFAGFGRWVADRAAGVRRAQDYFVELPEGPARIVERFTFLGGQKHRWFQFDSGQNVGWRAHVDGQPLVPGGGFAEFQTGINAWNNDAGSNVRYRYDGTTTATRGFDGGFDGINAILFNDPNDEIAGGFSCQFPGQGTGVLAVGGAWSDDAVVRDGYLVIQGGDIVTNDGAGCWFNTPKRAEQVFGHELGHTLGLGHSCGDNSSGDCDTAVKRDALMRASAHPDERGAKLGTDDKEGIAFLYPVAGGGGAKPAAPTGLAATAASSTSVQLAWTDNATNEQNYRVELKTTGNFTQVLLLPANSTAATITGLAPSTLYTFRVRAKNASGFSPYSASASATTQAPPPPPVPAAPANLVATPLSSTQVMLAWDDKSTNETGFRLEVTDQRDPYLAIEVLPANTESFVVNGLGPDFPYTFRLRAENSNGASAYSNEASVTIPGAGPCVVTAQNLCLLGGRFRVMVHWRIPATGANGVATAVPNSDQTGLFWFFDAANIELIVKVLDGRPLNNAFWTFYGGLSDVQYWVSVTDVQSGETATYHNPPGNLCGKADVGSFPQSGVAPAAAPALFDAAPATPATEALCAAGPNTLCLLGGRFQVEVDWRTGANSGVGTAIPYGDASGFFWFFDPANIELVVKVLDGRPLNGKFWFFYGALSDVAYDVTVTDTTTGAVKTYHNTQGNLCGRGDTAAF